MKLSDIKSRFAPKPSPADPSRAFGAEGQSMEEFMQQGMPKPEKPGLAERSGTAFSALKERVSSAAGRFRSESPAPEEADGWGETVPPEGYVPEGYAPEGYGPEGYDPQPPYGDMGYAPDAPYTPAADYNAPPSRIQADNWADPFTDPAAYDAQRQAAYAEAEYNRQQAEFARQQAEYEAYLAQQAAAANYPPEHYGDAAFGEPYPDGAYSPEDMDGAYAGDGCAAPGYENGDVPPEGAYYEGQPPYGAEIPPYAPPPTGAYGYDPYGQNAGMPPYGGYYGAVPAQPPRVRKTLSPEDIKYGLWGVSIAAGLLLTVVSFIYACAV